MKSFIVLAFSISTAVAQFRFAWLSDTHIGFPTGAENLRAVVRDINRQNDVKFVVISGDITEKGKNDELKLAEQILDSVAVPYLIVPGNHDTKWSESGCTMFSSLFGDDKFVYAFKDYKIIGMNSGIPLRGGGGHFAPQDVAWLDSVLSVTDPGAKIIFVCHHQPDGKEIDNTDVLLDRLKQRDIRFIGVGHGHSNRAYDFEGIEGVMFRSTLSRNGPAAYNIVDVRDDSIIVSQKNVGEPLKGSWRSFLNRRASFGSLSPKETVPTNPTVRVIWKYDAGATIGTGAATDGEIVVLTDALGRLTCLSLSTGKVLWQVKAGSTSIYSTPAISGGTVVFGASHGSIQARRKKDGALSWIQTVRGSVLSSPAVDSGTVFIGASDGKFRALDLESGTVKWEYGTIPENVEARPLVYGSRIIFGAWDGFLYALEKSTGQPLWRWSAEKPNFYYSPAACWPVAGEGKVFVVAPDKYATAVDPVKGTTVWRTNNFPVWESIGVSEDGSRIYLRGMTDTMYCLQGNAREPVLLWKTDCGYGFDSNPSMPVEKAGTVFLGSKSGLVAALDARTGALRWKHDTGNARTNTVTPVDGRGVVVTTMDGRVLYLRGKE